MKLVKLLDIASKGYPDEYTKTFYTRKGKFKDTTGDTLAKFIVIEISETYDEEATDEEQLDEASRVIANAISELQAVWDEVAREAVKAMQANGEEIDIETWTEGRLTDGDHTVTDEKRSNGPGKKGRRP